MIDTDIKTLLAKHFGFSQFRSGQEQTIQQLLSGHSSLAIFPTGSGKSLCYQLTATQLPHLTLVVSPLLALMKDQLDFLASKQIAAASIDSTLSADEMRQVTSDVKDGRIKILMVSVERFKNERFRQFMQSVPVSMMVVDEAHCISEWGHNFRPDYQKLPAYRQALNIPLVLLLTATATRKVKRDMALKFGIAEPHIVQTGFYRSNLDLTVYPVKSPQQKSALKELVAQRSGPGIVYVTLQHTAEEIAAYLQQQNIQAQPYHAGMEHEQRQDIQSRFMAGKIQVIVATIAFGMGIDKSDIRFVIHFDLPKSIENYSQEIGRAGRDGLPSNCVALANLDSINTLENFVYGDTPELEGIQYVLEAMRSESINGLWETQLIRLSNASNVRQLPLKTLLVQLELKDIISPSHSYFAEYQYKFLCPQEQILASFEGERKAFLEAIFQHTRTKKIWGEPDFDTIMQSTHSRRERIITALDYLHEKHLIVLECKRMTEVFKVDQAALSDPQLAQELHAYFADKEQKEISRIALLVRFFETPHCVSYSLARYFDDPLAPEHCGHCSLCRGKIAKLEKSQEAPWPNDLELADYLRALKRYLAEKGVSNVTAECCTRFLAGISVPMFSRFRVKQLSGFGVCQTQRYAEIREKLEQLN